MGKKKICWWRLLLVILLFFAVPYYLIFHFEDLEKNKKYMYVGLYTMLLVLCGGIIGGIQNIPNFEAIEIKDIIVYAIPYYLLFQPQDLEKKRKYIYVGTYTMLIVICSGVIGSFLKTPDIKVIHLNELTVYKDEPKVVEIAVTPSAAELDTISFNFDNPSLVSVDGKNVIGLLEGTTFYSITVTDSNGNTVTSDKAKVTVSLTEEQIAVVKLQEQEEAEKYEQLALDEIIRNRNIISNEESFKIKDYCKQIIDSILRAPSTAQYPGSELIPLDNWSMEKVDNLVTVKSYVDSQNRYGAMIRSEFVIQMQMDDDGSKQPTYVEFDWIVISGTFK